MDKHVHVSVYVSMYRDELFFTTIFCTGVLMCVCVLVCMCVCMLCA